MNQVRTSRHLQDERRRLELELAVQRELIKKDLADLKEDLRPARHAISIIGRIATARKNNPAISMGVDLAAELLISRFLFAKGGWIIKLVGPVLAKNFATHILNNKGTSVFKKLADKFRKRPSNGYSLIH